MTDVDFDAVDPWSETQDEEFSVFGELDVTEISDDPFHIDENTYNWVITKAGYKDTKDSDGITKTNVVVTITVDDTESEFHGKPLTQWHRVFPKLSRSAYRELDADDKATVDQAMSNTKLALRGYGLNESELNQLKRDTASDLLVGREFVADLAITERDGKKYKNLRNYKPRDDSPEDNDSTSFLDS